MRFFKEYKGVMLVYLIITIVNVLFVINYERRDVNNYNEVRNNNDIAMNINY